jgi:hypothetical protein
MRMILVCPSTEIPCINSAKLTNFEAIWDNRSVYNAATHDYLDLGERVGQRAVSLGEKPYFDTGSKSRQEALRGEGANEKTS